MAALAIQRPDHPAARRRAMSGRVTVGLVYPPGSDAGQWEWRLIVTPAAHGTCRSEQAAEAALRGAWAKFLDDARLVEAGHD